MAELNSNNISIDTEFYTQKRRGLKGSTLVETLVAMVLIVTAISISVMIYVSVITSDKQRKLVVAKLLIEQEVGIVKNKQLFVDESFVVNGISIRKQFTEYENSPQLQLFQIVAVDTSGTQLVKHQEIIAIQ